MLLTTKPIEDFSNDSAYSVTVLQINARWNKKNAVNIDKLHGCNIEWAYLEDQNSNVKKSSLKFLLLLLKKYEPLLTWESNIMFEPTVTVEELQDHVNNHR